MTCGIDRVGIADNATLLTRAELAGFGCTVIVAPHPDDESLACGGTAALLTGLGNPVHVLFISDGSMSHPGSKKYPAAALAKLRQEEALEAITLLGVPYQNACFLGLPDARVPGPESDAFPSAVAAITQLLIKIEPDTIILPWRRDPHPDHRASWYLVQAALEKMKKPAVVFEYPLWLWERGTVSDQPTPGEVRFFQIDVSSVQAQKQQAISAHRSQSSGLIDDDPQGFQLSPEVLAHFSTAFETFVQKRPTQDE